MNDIRAIPCNIISGFLGVGKTTAILCLLKNKPAEQAWAVLVNEFGEVGIDAAMLRSSVVSKQRIHIREVPGGCMCCAAGLPTQVALNQLISRCHPDRLLIEPSGLGHPREVVGLLTQSVYRQVIDLRATLTLVDARKISDPRYTEHAIFREQLQIADRVIANKQELYAANDLQHLRNYLQQQQLFATPLSTVSNGKLALNWLDAPHNPQPNILYQQRNTDLETSDEKETLPACGYLRKDNQGEGYISYGWIFSARFVFDYAKITTLLSHISAERLKAVLITSGGIYAFNLSEGQLNISRLDETPDSRIEVLAKENLSWAGLEAKLLDAIV